MKPHPEARAEALYRRGRRAHGDLGLDGGAFAALAADRLPRRRDASRPPSGPDLYLALACEQGHAAAWERLVALYRPRLIGLALARLRARGPAEEVVDDVLGSLALPAPRARAATRLGTYRGVGSLFGWLAVVVLRRIADRGRRGRLEGEAGAVGAEGVPGGAADPLDGVLGAEAADRIGAMLRVAWGDMTPRERLALVLKYGDGMPQRTMARLLGVGAPRVSRLVAQALQKVQAAARREMADGLPADIPPVAWPVLRDAVRERLATLGGGLRPPPGEGKTRGAHDGA